MTRDTRPGLVSAAIYSQVSRTCDRRHVSSGGGGGSLLRIGLLLCCVTVTSCGKSRDKMPRQVENRWLAMNYNSPELGYCDVDTSCDWSWNRTNGFEKTLPSAYGPTEDANNSSTGQFLWFNTGEGKVYLWSGPIPRTDSHCILEFWLYQMDMKNAYISLVIESNNVSTVTATKGGNYYAMWEKMHFNVGMSLGQPISKLTLEINAPPNSSIGVDNIRLVNCFPESTYCKHGMFRCNDSYCLNKTRVCDLIKDCENGEDEAFECDKIPENARCNFEDGWCGWTNISERPLTWTRRMGGAREKTGPNYDHTYRNRTGTYAYVDMSKRVKYGSRGTIDSPLYNPTPPYSSDPKSPYYKSCQIRFFYHQFGVHSALFALYLVQIKSNTNQSSTLWSSYGDKGDVWNNMAVALPEIKYRYFFQFEATKGLSSIGDVALDDISLSPECFGIGVPEDVVGDFNYYEPVIDFERKPTKHSDFANEMTIRIGTCGATGRTGPTAEQCVEQNNYTDVELIVPSNLSVSDQKDTFHLNGIQRWTAPRGEYYTLISVGARGGKGSAGTGIALGALVRGVIELQRGDQLYFMVGQEGTDACPKNLGLSVDNCQSPSGQSNESSISHGSSTSSKVREVKNMEFKDGGGGGGGATAVFTLKANGEPEPILIAGGGGGLGLGQFVDDGVQYGQGQVPREKYLFSAVKTPTDGHGASWSGPWTDVTNQKYASGMPLVRGGLGGFGCESGNRSYGNGGFGGGGGGCQNGGGGGGYIGGRTERESSGNGEGGYSYVSQRLAEVYFGSATHNGPGEILIIPAISGCGCDYRCVALDQYLNETKCLCPQGWLLSNDSKSCIMTEDSTSVHQTYVIPLIIVSSLLFVVGIFLIFYKRCQRYRGQKEFIHQDTELTALQTVHTMMTEYNPNYEFAGNLYTFKDLPQIPRDYISLLKPLGQGAFGQVFQGMYKYRRGEEHPVAVKTLPYLSTTQAEADFVMEALIMSKFDHPNIVHFIGVSFDKHPRYIILELLAGGDLKNFLREERPRQDRPTSLTMQDLIMCSYDVANGCKYMEQARFIHRDIAARNCLLTTKGRLGRTVKIADFGMARDIYRSDYYKKGGKAMLPIKWMPPESFMDGIFTTKTDVWAFGVLLWEIMSFGYMPYTGCANREVMTMVRFGGRLEKPAGCPDPIYGIMTRCWHPQPDDRPSFSTIAERIGYCLQDPDVINHPTPKFDILPIFEREMTIMRPDPEAECINMHHVQPDLSRDNYLQPRIIDPRVVHRVDQAVGGTIVYSERARSNRNDESHDTASTGTCQLERFPCNTYGSSTDTFGGFYSGDNDNNDRDDDVIEARPWTDRQNRGGTVHRNDNIEDHEDNIRNGNHHRQRPEEEDCRLTAECAMTDRRNGNESTTTTDTNSDSLIAQSSDTPPNTTTNSSPNTRTCSPNRVTGLSANGMVKKSTLKATLSLDPSVLCRGTISYEKITRTQRSSTPGSMELRKDSLSHELPREEECSC